MGRCINTSCLCSVAKQWLILRLEFAMTISFLFFISIVIFRLAVKVDTDSIIGKEALK